MNAKYKLIADDTIEITEDGKVRILYRIRALRDCWPYVRAGGFGGYIESTANLDTAGDAWVMGNACVYGEAKVSGHACVRGDAHVSQSAHITDNALIAGNARISGHVTVSGNARVDGNAVLTDEVQVKDKAHIGGNISLADAQIIAGDSRLGLPGIRKTEAQKAKAVIAQAVNHYDLKNKNRQSS